MGLVYGFQRLFMKCMAQKILTRKDQFTGSEGLSNKYCGGGPRLPNTSMVINVPVLQQGHFLSNVFTGVCLRSIFKLSCKMLFYLVMINKKIRDLHMQILR